MTLGEWESQDEPLLLSSLEQQQTGLLLRTAAGGDTDEQHYATSDEVIARMEQIATRLIDMLHDESLPVLETLSLSSAETTTTTTTTTSITKRFNMNQCRSFTSVLLVLSFCHSLLQAKRTTTTREVYYFYVTHFRSQRECDLAIWDAASLLQVPRHSLGLKASPKGWFCGDIQLLQDNNNTPRDDDDDNAPGGDDNGSPASLATSIILDGRSLQAIQGAPISSEWLQPFRNFRVHTHRAKCILVIEKEGVYHRLSEDRFFDHYPCILVTGKGFPDLATRALVHHLHQQLQLPVRGLADCNPFGVMVLHTYRCGGRKQTAVDGGDRYSVPMEWVGLRPSQVEQLRAAARPRTRAAPRGDGMDGDDDTGPSRHDNNRAAPVMTLPDDIFQELTELDKKRLEEHLLKEDHPWTNYGANVRRVEELEDMRRYKVELEALNWLGMDYCAQWVGAILQYHDDQQEAATAGAIPNDFGDNDEEPKEWLEII